MEVWKDIPNYEKIYQASDKGQIRSAPGKTTWTERHGTRHWKAHILKPKACADYNKIGYRVTLWKDGKGKDFLVARLVATTFLENLIDTKMTVNHKDGNRLNNNISNLEWLTLGDNIRHGYETGLYKQCETTLKNIVTGKCEKYRSQSAAGQAIGRNHGYISLCKQKNRNATGVNGVSYEIL